MARTGKSIEKNDACCRTATPPKLGAVRARAYAGWFKALISRGDSCSLIFFDVFASLNHYRLRERDGEYAKIHPEK